MYLVTVPRVVKYLYPQLVWDIPTEKKEVFLTFDDGPTPGVTDWVLDELDKYNAKATFFCLGKNAEKHPHLFADILKRGHAVGNHSYDHPNGWKTSTIEYIENVKRCEAVFASSLFRPPYGRISKEQINLVKDKYKLIMWSVLSADFDLNCTPQKCLDNVMLNTKSGSIIVFHDSKKAEENLMFSLSHSLKKLSEDGYVFSPLT